MRLFALRKAVLAFFREQKHDLANQFSDDSWLAKLGYLADVFSKLNELNHGLQGRDMDIFAAIDKIEAFKLKILLWKSHVEKSDVTDFPNLKTACQKQPIQMNLLTVLPKLHSVLLWNI